MPGLYKIVQIVNVFSLFHNDLSLEKCMAHHLNKIESQSFRDAMCQVWFKLAKWFWRRKFLNFVIQCIFCYFVIISPWKRVWPFIWTDFNPYQPRMLWAKLGWNLPSGSREDENVKSLQTDKWTDGQMDGWQTPGDQKSSLELSAQVS